MISELPSLIRQGYQLVGCWHGSPAIGKTLAAEMIAREFQGVGFDTHIVEMESIHTIFLFVRSKVSSL